MIEVAIIGRVGRSVMQRRTKKGAKWLNFSIAVSEGADAENVEWVNLAVFGSLVEAVPEDLQPGERVYVEGRAHINRFTDKHGKMRASLEVNVSRFEVMGRIGRRRGQGEPGPEPDELQKPIDPSEAPIPFDRSLLEGCCMSLVPGASQDRRPA